MSDQADGKQIKAGSLPFAALAFIPCMWLSTTTWNMTNQYGLTSVDFQSTAPPNGAIVIAYDEPTGTQTAFLVSSSVAKNCLVAPYYGPGMALPGLTTISVGALWFIAPPDYLANLQEWFSDGADGDLLPGASGINTFLKDDNAGNFGPWPVASTAKFITNGWELNCLWQLSINHAPARALNVDGSAGSVGNTTGTGGAAGGGFTSNTVGGSTSGSAGANGATGAGAQAAQTSAAQLTGICGNSGAGGAGTGGAGGLARNGLAANSVSLPQGVNPPWPRAGGGACLLCGGGSPGGGSGGGNGALAGGGGGGGAGAGAALIINAALIDLGGGTATAACLSSQGGAGANGGAGQAVGCAGGGGAAGAGGGLIRVTYCATYNAATANTMNCTGGAGGAGGAGTTGGGAGNGGGGGQSGRIMICAIGNAAVNCTDTGLVAGSAGSAAVGAVGGAGGAGGVQQATL